MAPPRQAQEPPETPASSQNGEDVSGEMAGYAKITRYKVKKCAHLSAKMQGPDFEGFVTSGFAYTKCPVMQK